MDISTRGLDLIKEFEGCHKRRPDGSIEAYLDPVGIPTIGWGCTKGVKMGMVVSEEVAEAMFLRELAKFEDAVERLVKVPLNQNQFDALVSFSYNVGSGALGKSTLLKLLNKGRYDAVPAQLNRFVNAGGRPFKGLIRRRAAEAALFAEPVPEEELEIGAEEAARAPEPMPQTAEPATGSIKQVVTQSWTLRGALTAFIGAITALYDWAFSTAQEAGVEAVKLKSALGPWDALFVALKANMAGIAAGIVLVGVGIVVVRKITGAREMTA